MLRKSNSKYRKGTVFIEHWYTRYCTRHFGSESSQQPYKIGINLILFTNEETKETKVRREVSYSRLQVATGIQPRPVGHKVHASFHDTTLFLRWREMGLGREDEVAKANLMKFTILLRTGPVYISISGCV